MQTLKFKIKHECDEEILEYQREYSSLLRSAFEFIKNDPNPHTLFDYKYKESSLMKTLKSMNNVELMNDWLRQCAISEAFQLVNSFKLKQEDYKKKLQRKEELEQKEILLKVEKKELKHLQKLKEPKVIFGGRNLFKQRCKNQISKKEFKQKRLSAVYSIRNCKTLQRKSEV